MPNVRNMRQMQQMRRDFVSALAATTFDGFMAAVAAAAVMPFQMMLLRQGDFCHIYNIWWLLRCGGRCRAQSLGTCT